jgi:hypothetical protein
MTSVNFWDVARYKSTDVSEEHTDYIFRVEDKGEQEDGLFFDP